MKTHTPIKSFVSLVLCVVMVAGLMSFTAFAAYNKDFVSETHDVFKHTESTLAPGVEQYINYAYSKDGKQMVYYVATADVTRDDVVIQSSYLKQHENGVMGMEKLTNQIAYANQKYSDPNDEQFISEHYNVVAGVNSSFYNMTTGQPMGITFIDGVSFGTNNYDNFFAILKDGKTAVIDYAKNLGNYVDENGKSTVWQAAAGSQWLVRDGKDVTATATGDYNTTRHCRTAVGITAEGKVVFMVLDGRQEPFSCGGTMHEIAQIMLEAGCVAAINLDGGGSTTYASRPEGADKVEIINRPSDGSERSISAGLIIASTAVPSNVFDHVSMTAADEYVTPGTSTKITVAGVSPSGASAEIPADISYKVTNGTYENGVLTAGEAGDVVLSAVYGGKEVGSVTIHAVVPERLAFANSSITVPYGKTVTINLSAIYGLNEVKFKASDIEFALADNGIGTIDGLSFTAGDGNVASSTVTATFVGTSVSATATINLGKGSVVLWDFEDGDVSEFYRTAAPNYNYILTPGSCSLATAANGKVHSGNYALRFNADFSVATESGYMNGRLGVKNNSGERIDLKGATRLGMWIYFPIEAKSLNGRIYLQEVTARNEDGSIKSVNGSYTTSALIDNGSTWDCGFTNQYEEPGWHYIYFDLEGGDWCIPANWIMLDFYVNDRDGSKFGYNHFEHKSQNVNVIMYLDDITVDYSSAVDDRDAPVFSDVRWVNSKMSDAVSFARGSVAESTDNVLSFGATVADFVRDNATGLDDASAKAYVDGVRVPVTIKNGVLSVADRVLADGIHTVKFSICDKQGNYASVIRQINVKADSGRPTVKLVAHDESLNNILLGSIYYIDLVATDIEKVQSVSADIDLNNMSRWELAHMNVAEGFTASYVISDADENIATVTVTRTGKTSATGDGMLVSIPVRTWELPAVVADGTRNNVWMYPEYRKGNEIWPIDISASVVRGEVKFVDGTTDTFTGSEVQVDTEAHFWTNETKPADYASWNGGHDHRAETKQYYSNTATNHVDAVALPDKAATCTEAGYTGRTFCEVCNSVVDWGTVVPASGHNYTLIDGVLQCKACGITFSGKWTDGKTYINGVAVPDGWLDESYYRDGVKLTGLQLIDGFYYDFGDDGICENRAKLDGFYFDKSISAYRHFVAGLLTTGEVCIYPHAYFFDANGVAVSGNVDMLGYECLFDEKGAFVSSENANVVDAGFSGTNIKYVLLADGTLKVDGEGEMKDYTYNGIYPAWIVKNDMNAITALEIGQGITRIGRFGFYRNGYLRKITFAPGSALKSIGWGAFGHCWRLAGVTIPASVEVLDEYAFYECGALEYFAVESGSNLTTIKSWAFVNDHVLKTVYIPDGVTAIGADILYKANASVKLLVAKYSVGQAYAEEHGIAYELREGSVPPLYSGKCGDTVTWALYYDGTLEIRGSGAMPNYKSYTEQPWGVNRHLIKKVSIGKDITSVGNYAFAYCQNLEEIAFEDGSKLTNIGILGFINAPKLRSVTLPETVTAINAYAFGDCFALESLYVPQGVNFIYFSAFSGSERLVLNVAEGTYAETFAKANNINCTVREFVYTAIASGACGDNAKWEFYENGELRISGFGAMTNYTAYTQQPWAAYRHLIKKVTIGKDITFVGNYAFAYCQDLAEISFEAGSKVTGIGILGFINAPKLKTVTLPESVLYIGAYAFGDCFALESLYVPQRVNNIYFSAFNGSDLLVLDVAEGTYSEQFAQSHNIRYTTRKPLDLPFLSGECGDGVTWELYQNGDFKVLGSGAMTNYTSYTEQPWGTFRHMIKKVIIGKDITAVGNYAFAYCQNLESIEFESGSCLGSIGILSFINAPKLVSVTLPDTVTSISAYAFGDCFALESLYIPDGVNFIYFSAFNGSGKLVLNVAAGSYAEKFAAEHKIDFKVR